MEGTSLVFGMAFTVGIGLGILFFGGLWLTVQRIPTASCPGLLALGSFWGRSAVCITGFYLVMDGDWARLLACFLGFLAARLVAVRHWRSPRAPALTTSQGEPI